MNASLWLKSFRQVRKRRKITWLFTYVKKSQCHLMQWILHLSNQWIVLWRMERESTRIPAPGMSIVDLNYYMTSYIQWIQLIISVINILSNTLIKLAKGSKLCITKFELKATCKVQTWSLSSKLSVQDDILRGTLYVCNQNFDQRQFFKCVACSKTCWNFGIFTKKIIRWRRCLCISAKISWSTSCLFENILQNAFLEVWLFCIWKVSNINEFIKWLNSYIKWIHLYLSVRYMAG